MKDVVHVIAISVVIAILCECALMVVRQIAAEDRRNRKRDR